MGLRGGRQADPLPRTFLQAKPLVPEGKNINFTTSIICTTRGCNSNLDGPCELKVACSCI